MDVGVAKKGEDENNDNYICTYECIIFQAYVCNAILHHISVNSIYILFK